VHSSDAADRGQSTPRGAVDTSTTGDSVILSKPMTSVSSQDQTAHGPPQDPSGQEEIPPQGPHAITSAAAAVHVSVGRPEPGCVVVHLHGEIDMATVPRLAELIGQRLTAAYLRTVVLDLSEVDFFSTSGLEMLLHTQRKAESRGVTLYVVPDQRCVRRLVELTGTAGRFCWRTSVAEAVAAAR
jgi:anti-anti-sigma factor